VVDDQRYGSPGRTNPPTMNASRQSRFYDGSRRVAAVTEVTGMASRRGRCSWPGACRAPHHRGTTRDDREVLADRTVFWRQVGETIANRPSNDEILEQAELALARAR